MRSNLLPVLAALSAPLLCGCVADYKQYAEHQPSTATEFSEPCNYRWMAEQSRYRAVDGRGYGWGDAGMRGLPGLMPYLKQISSKCVAPATAPQARISAYTLETVNQQNRKAMMVPAGFFQLATLGYVPLEMRNDFAVCTEARLPDGRVRVALAQGTLEAVTNVWGAMESLVHQGNTLKLKNREQLLQNLTQQSWNRLWAPGQALPEGSSCLARLDGLAR